MKRAIIFSGNLQNIGDLALLLQAAYGIRKHLNINEIYVRQWGSLTEEILGELEIHRIKVLDGKDILRCLSLLPSALLLFGGGQMVRDNTSLKSTIAIAAMMRLARFVGGKSAAIGCGASELHRPMHRFIWKYIIRQLVFFAARDGFSGEVVKALDARCDVVLTADIIHFPSPLSGELSASASGTSILVAPCEDASEGRRIDLAVVVEAIKTIQSTGVERDVVIVCHDFRPEMDPLVAAKIASALSEAGIASRVQVSFQLKDFISEYKSAHIVLTNRLHSVFFAALGGMDIFLLDDGNAKTKAAAKTLDISLLPNRIESIDGSLISILEPAEPGRISERRDILSKLSELAVKNFQLLSKAVVG